MSYYKKWRKRQADLRAVAESSNSSDGENITQVLGTHLSEEQAACTSPVIDDADDISSDYGFSDSERVISSDSDLENDDIYVYDKPDTENNPDLGEEIAEWAARNSCKRSAVNEILHILRCQGHRLPKDARTLLQTPQRVESVDKCGGQYAYFGIATGVLKILAQNPDFQENSIDICINIDGVPLFKSSPTQLWPILCTFHGCQPFIVAIYCGSTKPNSADEYLLDFIQELQQLEQDGIVCTAFSLILAEKKVFLMQLYLNTVRTHFFYPLVP